MMIKSIHLIMYKNSKILFFKIQSRKENFSDKEENNQNMGSQRQEYESRIASKRGEYIEDLMREDMRNEEDVSDGDLGENADPDDMFIYHLRNPKDISEDKLLVISLNDVMFNEDRLNNMLFVEDILRRVSKMYDYSKKSREIVQEELEKPIRNLQLEARTLLKYFQSDSDSDAEELKDELDNIKKMDIKCFRIYHKDYLSWIEESLQMFKNVNKQNFIKQDFSILKSSLSKLEEKFIEEEKEMDENDSLDAESSSDEDDNESDDNDGIEGFRISMRRRRRREETERKTCNDDNTVKKMEELIENIEKNAETNMDSMAIFDRFIILWEDFYEKVEYIKNALDHIEKTIREINSDFRQTYGRLVSYIPVVERYFRSSMNEIERIYSERYPNISSFSNRNINFDFDQVRFLPPEETITIDPDRFTSVQRYIDRGVSHVDKLLEKDASSLLERVQEVKRIFTQGIPFNPLSGGGRGRRRNRFRMRMFMKSFYDHTQDLKKNMDRIINNTIHYERILESITEKVNDYIKNKSDIERNVTQLSNYINELDNQRKKIKDNDDINNEWNGIENKKQEIIKFCEGFKDIQEKNNVLYKEIHELYMEQLTMSLTSNFEQTLENLNDDLSQTQVIYNQLPEEFNGFEENMNLYETNAMKLYDQTAFIYLSIESLRYQTLEDILELEVFQKNHLFQDFFEQTQSFFEA